MVEKGKKITLVKEILQEKYKIMENSKGTKKKKKKYQIIKNSKGTKTCPHEHGKIPDLLLRGTFINIFALLSMGRSLTLLLKGALKNKMSTWNRKICKH